MSDVSFSDYWDKQWRDFSGDEDSIAKHRRIASDAYKAGILWAFTDRDAMLDQIARLREALERIADLSGIDIHIQGGIAMKIARKALGKGEPK